MKAILHVAEPEQHTDLQDGLWAREYIVIKADLEAPKALTRHEIDPRGSLEATVCESGISDHP